MIIDERTYTIRPTKVKAYLDLYEKMGMAVQTRIQGQMIGYFTVEIGGVNQIVHMWGYKSLGERERIRAELWQNEEWLAYVEAVRQSGDLVHQENRILVSTSFSPL
jgi:NIPSNAP